MVNINKTSWDKIAREKQKIPQGNWKIWLILAGRGFGKTRTAAESVRKMVLEEKCRRIALISETINEGEKVMVEGESGLISISESTDGIKYFRNQKKITWKNGAMAFLYGADEYDKLRGPQFDFAWIDEFAKFKYPFQTFNQLNFSLRLGENPKTIITTTPRPLKIITDLMARRDVHVTKGTSFENVKNLSPNFIEQLNYLKGTSLEAQEIYGEIVSDNADELWSLDNMASYYKQPSCAFENVIIAVDPAVTSGKNSDETGIIVCGKDELGLVYILDDLSSNKPSNVWIPKIIEAYHAHKATLVVIESNQGGDLIKNSLVEKDKNIKVSCVYAHKSKKMRAVPIAALYSQKKVFHIRQFHKLEMQMSSFISCKKSPDRVDALVWGISTLMKKQFSQNPVSAFFL